MGLAVRTKGRGYTLFFVCLIKQALRDRVRAMVDNEDALRSASSCHAQTR